MLRRLVFTALLLCLPAISGCEQGMAWIGATLCQADTRVPDSVAANQFIRSGIKSRPRVRLGYEPVSDLTTVFLGKKDLGRHGYRPNLTEKNGLVYTCKAGHIDISHARKAADWTAFLAAKSFEQIMSGETEFSFKMHEPSQYFIELSYPQGWEGIPQQQKEDISAEVSLSLGRYFTFVAVTWHEIITWFGFKSFGSISEQASAFSWEDSYSNVFGIHIATLALADSTNTYNDAMTIVLERELLELGVQPFNVSSRAAESVKGSWYSKGLFSTTMRKRNLDIGLGDGFITATLIPSVSDCRDAIPQSLAVPNLDVVSDYGFSVKIEIDPKVWEANSILKIAYPDKKQRGKRICPRQHFPVIMDYIKADAVKRYSGGLEIPY